MFKRFLEEESAASMLEYIIGGTIAIALLGTCVWALMNAVKTKGDEATTGVGDIPSGITAPGGGG